MELVCYEVFADRVELRPSQRRREWMDETPNQFAYRCLPLAVANTHGWDMVCPFSFDVVWNGGPGLGDVAITAESGADISFTTSHFGNGILTFNPLVVMKTEPGWNLWVSGPTNRFKDGIQAMQAVMETDWMPYTFSMNWKLTRPGLVVRFEKGEPFCSFFPIRRGVVAECEPTVRSLASDAALETEYRWAHARRGLGVMLGENPKEQFQGWYMRGEKPDKSGTKIADHEAGITPKPFRRE